MGRWVRRLVKRSRTAGRIACGEDHLGKQLLDPNQASATRATISAGTSQTAALAQDEILLINGVNIQLFSGMAQDAVIDQINKYSVQTGVWYI